MEGSETVLSSPFFKNFNCTFFKKTIDKEKSKYPLRYEWSNAWGKQYLKKRPLLQLLERSIVRKKRVNFWRCAKVKCRLPLKSHNMTGRWNNCIQRKPRFLKLNCLIWWKAFISGTLLAYKQCADLNHMYLLYTLSNVKYMYYIRICVI